MKFVEKILMNKDTGVCCPAIRVQFFDKVNENMELENLQGYSIVMRENTFDGWLIFSGDESAPEGSGPWMYVQKNMVDEKCEVIE